jgi:type III pantothenate kinase
VTLLLIDIGNTRVKWARLVNGKMTKQRAAANAGWTAADYARRVIGKGWQKAAPTAAHRARAGHVGAAAASASRTDDVGPGTGAHRAGHVGIGTTGASRTAGVGPAASARHARTRRSHAAEVDTSGSHTRSRRSEGVGPDTEADTGAIGTDRIVVASVAGDQVNRALTEAARQSSAPTPEFVTSERKAAGITTDYIDPWRLGVDRFVAAIGAHHLASASGQPVCVVSIGTAMTIDLIDGRGRHHGGAIVPGPALMVSSLLTQTNGIRRRAKGGPKGATGMFAKSTRNAIGEGARYAAAGVIERALEEARILLGNKPLVLLTGGGAADIKPLIRSTAVSLPDLVLHGLAVWAHETPSRKPRRVV